VESPLPTALSRVALGCCLLVLAACGVEEPVNPDLTVEGFAALRHEAPRGTVVLVVEGLAREDLAVDGPLADLARRGTVFSAAFGSTSTAGAARASLATGEWPRVHGLEDAPATLEASALSEVEGGEWVVARGDASESPAHWIAPEGSYLTWIETADVEQAGTLLRALLAHLEEVGELESTYVWAVGVPASGPVGGTQDPLPPVGLAAWRQGHVPPGEVRPQVVGTLDVHATLRHLAHAGADAEGHALPLGSGLGSDGEGPGASFGRLLLMQPQVWRGYVVGETPAGKGRAVVRGDYLFWRAENGDEGLFSQQGGTNLVGRPEAALIEDELRVILGR